MKRTLIVATLIACFTFSLLTVNTNASDWIGVYARVDKVVLEPNDAAPERVQIWGAFAIASKEDRSTYQPAKRGYLYYSVKPGKEDVCRKEWADLKAIAGTGRIVGFGGRELPQSRVRKASDKPADPDVYPISVGLVKIVYDMSDYAPIRELTSLPREQK
ncbi:MAG TPA: hypothetical protein VGL29_13015 [Blastocatellia bacterium]|jgi:hypothetical protein